jgi:propanediol dehydratase small subunit
MLLDSRSRSMITSIASNEGKERASPSSCGNSHRVMPYEIRNTQDGQKKATLDDPSETT